MLLPLEKGTKTFLPSTRPSAHTTQGEDAKNTFAFLPAVTTNLQKTTKQIATMCTEKKIATM
jgi:hypothetical protein